MTNHKHNARPNTARLPVARSADYDPENPIFGGTITSRWGVPSLPRRLTPAQRRAADVLRNLGPAPITRPTPEVLARQAAHRAQQLLASLTVTPEAAQRLHEDLLTDYRYPLTGAQVVEVISSPTGRPVHADLRLVAAAQDDERPMCQQSRDVYRQTLVDGALGQVQVSIREDAPMTPGHAWWSGLTDEQRAFLVSEAIACDRFARDLDDLTWSVTLCRSRLVVDASTWEPHEIGADHVLLAEYRYGYPQDPLGVGMPDRDAAIWAICSALGVA